MKPTFHPCQKKLDEAITSREDDYADLVNTVERHSKCSSHCCLRQDILGNQYYRFYYPFEMNNKTYIKYNKVTSRGESHFKPEIVTKRNDPRVNRHQQIQLQGWRDNYYIQLIIDHHACIEYLAKYASKAEKLSSVARDAFVSVIRNIQENLTPQNLIRKLIIKSVGKRKMRIQKVMHQILE